MIFNLMKNYGLFFQLKDTLTKLAKIFKGKLMFIVVDTEIKDLKQIVDFFPIA